MGDILVECLKELFKEERIVINTSIESDYDGYYLETTVTIDGEKVYEPSSWKRERIHLSL